MWLATREARRGAIRSKMARLMARLGPEPLSEQNDMTQSNTDLPAFIAEHAHPYDAATDTYRRAPFAQPTKAGKNTAIYNAHSYHTKVPPLGIVPYIEH